MEDLVSQGWVVPRQPPLGLTQLGHREPAHMCTYIHTDVYTDSGVNMYLRERETDEVAIFRWTLSSGLFRWSLFIAWLNTACLCCTHTHRDTQFNMCYQFKEPMANLVNRVEVAGGHVQ